MKSSAAFIVPVALVLGLALLLRIADPPFVSNLRLAVFDAYLRLSPRVPDPDFPVRVVAVDEASLQTFGQWPWPRTIMAQLVTKLREAGAKTISLDIILPEPDRLSPENIVELYEGRRGWDQLRDAAKTLPSNDAELAAAIAAGPVVAGFHGDPDVITAPGPPRASFVAMGDDPKPFLPSFPGAVSSLEVLTKQAPGLGATNWVPDSDLIVRRVPLLINIGGQVYPTLTLEAFRLGSGAGTVLFRSSGGSAMAFGTQTGIEMVKVGETVFPTNGHGELWLRFSRAHPKRTVSARDVLSDGFDGSLVSGRHIFIGASAVGLYDLRATPLASSVPGVEIHAQALEQMLSGEHVIRPAYAVGYELLYMLGIGMLVAYLVARSGPAVAALAGLVAILGVVATSWMAYQYGGLLFDPVYPSLAVVATYLAASLPSYIATERERARVRSAFSSYVAPQLVEQLVETRDELKLGGEMREVTLLFADVRQFSRIAERLDAEGVVDFINDLFTPLSDVILDERGTIDKFMGDAVMAFWNAPLRDPDHEKQACRAALRMMEALDELNARWAKEAQQRSETHTPVRIGIGLNTGDCCVGNVGSPTRFDYSILGDAVNVASRLEAETKTYAVPIIAGEKTVAGAKFFAFLEIDQVTLRGMSRPEKIYALMGDEAFAATKEFRKLQSEHNKFIAARSKSDQRTAGDVLNRASDIGGERYAPLASHYRKKLA